MSLTENFVMLAVDTSASPGFAVVEVRARGKHKGRPLLLGVDSIKTGTDLTDAQRYEVVRAKTLQVCFDYQPFDVVAREHFSKGGSKRATQLVFGGWAAVDSALQTFGYQISTDDELTPNTVKKTVGGRGGADKEEVEAGVRHFYQLPEDYVFRSDDEADAAAIAYTWLLQKGLITEWHKKVSSIPRTNAES